MRLTERQQQAWEVLAGPKTHVMLFGGSRSGKTFLLIRAIITRALNAAGSRHAVLRFRFNAVKQSICYDTWPRVLELCFPGVENEALLYLLDEAGVCASAASACASGAMEPSHVLAAMGVDRSLAHGALRLSLGHTTTDRDVDRVVEAVVSAVRHLRERAANKKSGAAS